MSQISNIDLCLTFENIWLQGYLGQAVFPIIDEQPAALLPQKVPDKMSDIKSRGTGMFKLMPILFA